MPFMQKSVSTLAATLLTIGALAGGAQAANVFTTFTMPATTTNVGTFSIKDSVLYDISQLGSPGPYTYNVVYEYFTPSVSGVYTVGIADTSYDPVMMVYEGQTSFPSSNPGAGAIAFNDDGGIESFNGLTFTNSFISPYVNSVLQNLSLTAGTTYMVAATSFYANETIPLPLEFFVYGEPVTTGDAAVPEPSSALLGLLGTLALFRRNRR
jgi:hypothetical protein